jgi:hypothetical protein
MVEGTYADANSHDKCGAESQKSGQYASNIGIIARRSCGQSAQILENQGNCGKKARHKSCNFAKTAFLRDASRRMIV